MEERGLKWEVEGGEGGEGEWKGRAGLGVEVSGENRNRATERLQSQYTKENETKNTAKVNSIQS